MCHSSAISALLDKTDLYCWNYNTYFTFCSHFKLYYDHYRGYWGIMVKMGGGQHSFLSTKRDNPPQNRTNLFCSMVTRVSTSGYWKREKIQMCLCFICCLQIGLCWQERPIWTHPFFWHSWPPKGTFSETSLFLSCDVFTDVFRHGGGHGTSSFSGW